MYVLRHRYVSLAVRFPQDCVYSCGNPEYTIIHNGQPDQMNASFYLLVWYLWLAVECVGYCHTFAYMVSHGCVYSSPQYVAQ